MQREPLHERAFVLCNASPWPLHKKAFVFGSVGRCIRRGSRCATRPLLTAFGRTPASGRRAPQRVAVIKRFLGFCGLRSWRSWSWAAKSEPRRKLWQRHSPPPWGARRPDAGVRPSAQREKGGRCKTRTSSLNPRENGGRCKTQTPSHATTFKRSVAKRKRPLMQRLSGRIASPKRPLCILENKKNLKDPLRRSCTLIAS